MIDVQLAGGADLFHQGLGVAVLRELEEGVHHVVVGVERLVGAQPELVLIVGHGGRGHLGRGAVGVDRLLPGSDPREDV